jgi:hypothetical protein
VAREGVPEGALAQQLGDILGDELANGCRSGLHFVMEARAAIHDDHHILQVVMIETRSAGRR